MDEMQGPTEEKNGNEQYPTLKSWHCILPII